MDIELDRRIRNLFPSAYSESIEEQEVIETRNLPKYQRARDILLLYMRLGSLTFKESKSFDRKNPNSKPLRNILAYPDSVCDPPVLLAKSKLFTLIWRSKLTRPIYLLLYSSFIIELLVITILRFKHDSLTKNFVLNFNPNLTRTTDCALEIDFKNFPQSIRTLEMWLKWLGDPTLMVEGGPLLFYQFIIGSFLFMFLANIYTLQTQEIRLDCLNFLLDPQGERQRMNAELTELAYKVFGSAECSIEDSKGRFYFQTNFREFRPRRISGCGDDSIEYQYTLLDTKSRHFTRRFDSLMRLTHFVKPDNLTPRWHKLFELANYLSIIPLLTGIFVEILVVIYLIGLNFYIKVQHRLNDSGCKLWRADAFSVISPIQLDPLRFKESIDAYKQYDGSFSYFIYLAFIIEPQDSLSLNESINSFMLIYAFLSSVQWVTIYLTTYAVCFVDKLRWLNQVHSQVKCCADLSRLCYLKQGEYKFYIEHSDKLSRLSTITYLNYMLFESHYLIYANNVRFIVKHTMFNCFFIMSCSYIVVNQTDNYMVTVVLLGVSYFILQTNFTLISGAFLYTKFKDLMKHITRLVAYSTYRSNNSNHSRMMQLWIRQELDLDQVKKLFAFQLWGNFVTYGFFISINVYLIFLWMILFKKEHDKRTN